MIIHFMFFNLIIKIGLFGGILTTPKLFITRFSRSFCNFCFSLRHKYSPLQYILKYLRLLSFPQCEWHVPVVVTLKIAIWSVNASPSLRLLLEWLYSPCGPSPLVQFLDLFFYKRQDSLNEWSAHRKASTETLDGKWPIQRPPLGLRFFNVQ
jgi:hypothetical protein